MGELGAVVLLVLLILGAIHNSRRRARMTPEERAADDQLRATRELTRELRRNRRL